MGTNPKAPDYIGKHPGNAFMELQFYGPGYVPQFEGFGCAKTQYCAAMTIDSFVQNQNTGVANTSACNNYVLGGPEPINWAYITKSGKSQAPANPLFTGTLTNPNFAAVNPDLRKDLLMSPGDVVRFRIHDTRAGLRIDMADLTTGQNGSMTASVANGFGHILYRPKSATCQEKPYAFHPEYSTANPRGNTWSAHTYNVAMSDEIGHFENCLAINADGDCTKAGGQDPSLDADDSGCVPGTDSLLVKIDGCFSPDEDFDGQSYRPDWPGTNPNVAVDRALHPSPVLFTSPTDPREELPDDRVRDRPAADRGIRLAGQPAVLRPDDRRELREPAAWRAVLPVLLDHGEVRVVHLAGRRQVPARDHERLRRQFHDEYGPLLKTVFPDDRIHDRRSCSTTSTAATCRTPARSAKEAWAPVTVRHGPRRERGPPSRSVPEREERPPGRVTAAARCSDRCPGSAALPADGLAQQPAGP